MAEDAGAGALIEARDATGVVTLTLNRPAAHNALSGALIGALTAAAARHGADPETRVVALRGAGASFCAGGDLGWMRAQMAADRATRMAEARRLAGLLQALNTLPKPLIAAVNGQAYGGGVGLISVADVAIAVETARFGLTETRLGLTPATISPYVLARIGEGAARRVMLSGRRFGADEAKALGLIAEALPEATFEAAVRDEIAAHLVAAPGAIAAAKALARARGPVIDAAVIEATVAHLADVWETAEAQEGVAAFFEKRTPAWRLP